jgi:hypothetical protein
MPGRKTPSPFGLYIDCQPYFPANLKDQFHVFPKWKYLFTFTWEESRCIDRLSFHSHTSNNQTKIRMFGPFPGHHLPALFFA